MYNYGHVKIYPLILPFSAEAAIHTATGGQSHPCLHYTKFNSALLITDKYTEGQTPPVHAHRGLSIVEGHPRNRTKLP